MTEPDAWRKIRCVDVCWEFVSGVKWRRVSPIYARCREDASEVSSRYHWYAWTLGDLADAGEKAWQRAPGIGPAAVEVIKITIDAAAAGVDVTQTAANGYKPRPFKAAP